MYKLLAFTLLFVGSTWAQTISLTPYVFTTVTGKPATGIADGTGSAASFNYPSAVAVDATGNRYVSDTNSHTIRKISAAGSVSTLAGTAGSKGAADGIGSAARFNFPAGLAVDGAGNVFVADAQNHAIRKITAAGVVSTVAGLAGSSGSTDGTGGAARFQFPSGVVVDGTGNLYVVDSGNHTIRKITPAGVVTIFAGSSGLTGSTDATGSAARFSNPQGLAIGADGTLYVTDAGNSTIRKITTGGAVTTLAGSPGANGSTDGTGSAARFGYPVGIAVDGAGNVFVADTSFYTIRKITSGGVVTTFAGLASSNGSADGAGSAARFDSLKGLAVDTSNNLFAADTNNQKIRKITNAGVVTTVAGADSRATVDGIASIARLNQPAGCAVVELGSVCYVTEPSTHVVRIIAADGSVSTFAGAAGLSGSTDGQGATARFKAPSGIAVDALGNLYVADSGNYLIRKISSSGEVSTLAGTAGTSGAVDGTGSAAQFKSPNAVAVDSNGNVYVADGTTMVRKITPDGVVTTLAGGPDNLGSNDGVSGTAQFFNVAAIGVDRSGTVFVIDQFNSTIRKITPGGVVTTFAGTVGIAGSNDGTGTSSSFIYPRGMAMDGSGNIYVTDSNLTIRRITPAGVVTTLAGDGNTGSADGVGAAVRFDNTPTGVAVDAAGRVYVADTGNNTLRKGMPVAAVVATPPSSRTVTATYPVSLSAGASGTPAPTYQWFKDGVSLTGATNAGYDLAGATVGDAGSYSVTVSNSGGSITSAMAVLTVNEAPTFTTLAGSPLSAGAADGTGSAARFDDPYDVAVDNAGSIFVADINTSTIRKITPTGVVTTLAGSATSSGAADGTGSSAQFSAPYGLTVDASGYVYVADTGNHTIRKISPAGVVTTFAGSAGSNGAVDGAAGIARFDSPADVVVDGDGNVFVADWQNSTIRKISPGGVVSTYAGFAGSKGSADGTGSTARFYYPISLAIDGFGALYVADMGNNNIRKITAGGVVTTLAGTAGYNGWVDGVGRTAQFYYPNGLAVDGAGNVYVGEAPGTVRRITPGGVVTTIAGVTGDVRGTTDGIGSANRFFYPSGVAVGPAGQLYVADSGNHTIRQGALLALPVFSIQPVSQTVRLNYPVTLSVAVSGYQPPVLDILTGHWVPPAPSTGATAVQWRKNGVNITGANEPSYTIENATLADAGNYTVVATNLTGTTISQAAALEVAPASSVAIGADFNHDGKSDIFWQNTVTGAIGTWFMNGTIAPTNEVSALPGFSYILPEWLVAATGDFNGDGKTDLVWQNTRTGERAFWLMNDLTLVAGVALGTYDTAWSIAAAGDFNGDGKPDLVWQNLVTGERAIWLMNGTTFVLSVDLGTYPPVWSIAATGDFNADGKTDLVWQNTATGERAVWLMNGTTLTAGIALGVHPELEISGTGDYNGDGRTDLIWTNPSTGERVIWLMSGTTMTSSVSLGVIDLDWVINRPVAHFTPPPPGPPIVSVVGAVRQVLAPGQSLSLVLTATGTGTLTYQWSHNGRVIAGATSSTYVRPSVTVQDGGYYLLTVADTIGTTRSVPIFVTVAPAYSQVRAWGNGSPALATVPANLNDAIAISAVTNGDSANLGALALRRDGTVVVLGGAAASPDLTPPPGLTGVVAVSSGDGYALALKSDGTVVAWGTASYGRALVPAGLNQVVAIATSGVYSFALKSDGTVVQWGTLPAHQIVVAAGLTDVVAMSASDQQMLFLKSDGSVVSRGLGEFVTVAPVPSGATNVSAIAAGISYSLALKNDGSVISWSEPFQPVIAVPSGLNGVVAIATGAQSLALKSDGTVIGWGGNARGEATPPGDLINGFAVAAGKGFSLALCGVNASGPVFTTAPAGQSLAAGYKLTLVGVASGAPTPTYQWSKNGIAIPGATSGTFTIASVTAADEGAYRVTATNLAGTVTSDPATVSVTTRSLAAISNDFNGDGKSDLLWQNRITGERSLSLLNGLGVETDVSLGLSPTEWAIAAIADFNADGKPDLLWQNTLTGARAFWLMNGTTYIASAGLGTYSPDLSIAGAGDFNGDGKPDLIWQNTSTGERSIWLMNGTTVSSVVALGTFLPEWSIAGSADFNADGKSDLVWQNTVTGERALWLMNGTTVTQGVALGVHPALQISGTGDYNGDGQPDIIWTNLTTGERGVWLMNGTTIANTVSLGVYGLEWTLFRPVFRRVLSDFNNDGKSDLVWQNTATGDRAVWLMNGTTARMGLSLGNYPVNQWIAAVGDFNNDGKADLVWQNTTTGARSFTLLDGTTVLSTVTLGTYSTDWSIVTTGDFNADGRPDLVWSNSVTGDRAIWLMDGTAFTAGVSLGTVSTQLRIAGAGDFNGDGQTDILWQNTATGERSIWLMNGLVHTSSKSLITYAPASSVVGTGDYNGDGKPDLLEQNTVSGERLIRLMDGVTELSTTVIGSYDTAWSIRN